ncbi:hypothetical protein GQ53DRAFT_873136 [Thozetella sp. PMI_491]|nr:hypothetical protein GQ53DRAFT_873136 [Thozetella sp. PMI_491]
MSFESHTALYTDKFKRFLSSIKRTNWQGKNFYPQEPIRKWMTENNDLDPEGLQSNLEFLFREAYKNSSRVFEPAGYSPSVIQNRCLFVFTILLYLNCGSFIHKFQRHEIDDEFLARLSNDIRLEKIVSALETLPNAEGLAKEFLRLRWQFFPAQITYEMDSSFTGNQYILPFIDTEEINTKGGTANVHLYRIQVDLITSPDLHEALGPSKHYDPKFGQCYSLAVKTYHAGSEDSYELEIDAFSGIGDQQGIVKYLGQYHYDSPRGPIHHIMLEYGERDLDEYLADTYPPVMFTEMDAFWTDIFSIAETIRNLHDLSHNGEHVRGWHGDIKPDNILRVHGKYKLADFGFAKFEKNSTQGGTKMDGGTHSYGAPECDVSRDVSVPHLQTIDTWSFGCVLSSVATWVILSSQAYDQYRDYRQREIKILKQRRKQGEQVNAPTADDAFHDGRNVLQAVKDWHDYLRQSIRKCDFFSERVLDLVEHHMLLADPTERYTLDLLCEKLEEILVLGRMNYKQSLRKSGSRELPGSILQFLLEKDLRAPKVATPAEKLKQEARLAPEKSKRVNKSMRWVVGKTANREQVLQEKLEPWLRETTETRNPVASGPQALKGLESQRTNSFGIPHRSESPPRISSHANRGLDEGPSPPPPPARTITEHGEAPRTSVGQNFDLMPKKRAKWTFKSFGGLVEVDRQLKNYIENRDIMFIVDNSATMRPYWTAVQMVLLTLAMKIGPLDEDGLDLRFTIGYDHNVEGAREWNILKSFEASMKACGAEIGPAHETNMAETLRPILDMYRRQLKKKLTLIILTDGMWSGRANNVEELIAKFLPSLEKQLGKLEERWFSIQFVTFGNDPLALRRMQELDDKMHAKYNVSDAIDTKEWCYEPINMLIMGSITEDGDDHASPPPTSPLSPTQASSSQYLGPSVDQVFMPPQRSASAHSTKSQSGSFRNRLSGLSGKLRGE